MDNLLHHVNLYCPVPDIVPVLYISGHLITRRDRCGLGLGIDVSGEWSHVYVQLVGGESRIEFLYLPTDSDERPTDFNFLIEAFIFFQNHMKAPCTINQLFISQKVWNHVKAWLREVRSFGQVIASIIRTLHHFVLRWRIAARKVSHLA